MPFSFLLLPIFSKADFFKVDICTVVFFCQKFFWTELVKEIAQEVIFGGFKKNFARQTFVSKTVKQLLIEYKTHFWVEKG